MNPDPSKEDTKISWPRLALWVLVLVIVVPLLYYLVLKVFFPAKEEPLRLVVYGFSTQEEAFNSGVLPAFEQAWEAEHGGNLVVEGVFGASGTLAGQINLGAPADVALFSVAQHADWLKIGRMVSQDAQPLPYGCTPMVIAVRPGNPHAIRDYASLTQPGLQLVHADPRSSGGGDWALLAEYGSALLETGDEQAARRQVGDIWANVGLLSPSARQALTSFELGASDALVTYEQDALLALERGVALEVVVPRRTILALPVLVVVEENVTRREQPVVQAFVEFLLDVEGQAILQRFHLRPPLPACQAEQPVELPFLVEDLGGWSSAYRRLVEDFWQAEILPGLKLEQ